jgi:Tfp pilus assembly protein PilV
VSAKGVTLIEVAIAMVIFFLGLLVLANVITPEPF